jgi:hypothetical protein
MVRLDILKKLMKASDELTAHQSNPVKNFFIFKIFFEFKKYILIIFRYKKNTTLNEFSSSFGKYKTRRIS